MIDMWEIVLAIAHVSAATLVTIHVLLTHRDVRSSIGWIGLSWLSPFIGSSIYIAFGVNRVVRRAVRSGLDHSRLAYAGEMEAHRVLPPGMPRGIVFIGQAADSLSGLPLTPGNRVELLENGAAAYPRMLADIAAAQHTIALCAYIFAGDAVGLEFARALIDARRRGVRVLVLVDGVGSGYFRSIIVEKLREGGVETAQFLHEWAPWAMPFINLRNHKKLLVVDGKIGFTGGMNISALNVEKGGQGLQVRDVHARIEGPVVAQLLQTFERDWEFTTGNALVQPEWWPEPEGAGHICMRGISSGPDESMGRIEALFATAVEQAEKRVRIVTPYFLPEDRLFEVIQRASMRGVFVEILVPEKTNHFYFDWAMAAHMATFSLQGLSFYLTPGPFDHSKLMSVDGHWCSIGSANWDARSMRLNFEFQVECYDMGFTGEVDRLIDQKKIGATLLDAGRIAARSLPVKLRDSAARLLLPYL